MAFTVSGLIMLVVMAVINLFLGAYLLQWATKLTKRSDTSWDTAFGINMIVVVIGFVLGLVAMFVSIPLAGFIGLIVGIWLIKTRYNLSWKDTAITWLVWFVLSLVAGIVIGLVLGLVLAPIFVMLSL